MDSNHISNINESLSLFGISYSKIAKVSGCSATYVGTVLKQTIKTDSKKTRRIVSIAEKLVKEAESKVIGRRAYKVA